MSLIENIKMLSNLTGVSGYEDKASSVVKEMLDEYCDESYTDSLGNLVAIKKCGKSNAKRIMIEAHIDEIGFMVNEIDDNGFIKFVPIGGVDPRTLLSKEVIVHGKKDIFGVIGATPPHILSDEDMGKAVEIDKLYIDCCMSKKELEKSVEIGDVITVNNQTNMLLNNRISTKCQDDRTSVAAILEILEKLKNTTLSFDLYCVAATQEEVGCRGSKTVTYGIDPDVAIVIDVCHGDSPDASKDTYKLGDGTIITKGPNIHPILCDNLIKILDKNNIKYTVDVEGGHTGTDAWSVQVAKNGVPTVLFSIPLRYMHTCIETLSVDDVISTVDAIYNFLISTKNVEDVLC